LTALKQSSIKTKPTTLSEQKRQAAEKRRRIERDITVRKCANMPRRLERLADPIKFLKGYFPNEFSRPFSSDQEEAVHTIIACAKANTDEIICAPRGDWKTETLKHLVIYLILAELVRFPVWIGATVESAVKAFEHIKHQFESDRLSADFPEVCDPVIALQGSAKKITLNGKLMGSFRWGSKLIILPSIIGSPYGNVMMTYRGLDSNMRGLNILGRRPDLALCDDLETEESARMDGQIETREALLDNAIGGLASGETIPRIVLGTIQNTKCLTRKKLIQWGGKRYQAVHKWPESQTAIDARNVYIEMRREEKRKGSKSFDESYQHYEDNQAIIEDGLEMGSPHNYSRKFRQDGRPLEISAFQRVLNAASDKGWDYVHTEIQNDPQEKNLSDNLSLTPTIVASRISGLRKNELPRVEGIRITCGMDIGNLYSHWVKIAWFGNATGVILDYGVAENPLAKPHMNQAALSATLLPSLMNWRNDIMAENPPDLCFIDSGSGTHQEAVYEFVRQVGGVPFAASKGWDKNRYPAGKDTDGNRMFYECSAARQANAGLWLYHVNAEFWKQWLQERFITPTFDEAMQFNDGSLSLYSDQDRKKHMSIAHHVVAEMRESTFVEGKGLQTKWVEKSANNHYLDALGYACAAAGVLGVRLVKRESMQQVPKKKEPPKVVSRMAGLGGKSFVATR